MNWGSLRPSARVSAAALVAMALVHQLATYLAEGELVVFALVIEAVLVGLAVLVSTGRWWASALGAVASGFVLVLTALGSATRFADLGLVTSIAVVLFLALALVATIGGVSAAAQGYQVRRV